MDNLQSYPIFKGLQKPLEFMGIRGRFLTIAAISIGASFLGFFIAAGIFGQGIGFLFMLICIAVSIMAIFIKQKQGLHNKKKAKGVFVYHSLFRGLE